MPDRDTSKAPSKPQVLREFEFYGGCIRVKISVKNTSGLVIADATLELESDENVLHFDRCEPEYSEKKGKLILGSIYPNTDKTTAFYLDPLICAKEGTDINCRIFFKDAFGRSDMVQMEPLKIKVVCPIFRTEQDINIGRLKELVSGLQFHDSKVYTIPRKVEISELLRTCRNVIQLHDVRHIKTFKTADEKTYEAWYYGKTKVTKKDLVIKCAICKDTESIEVFASGNDPADITGLLAEIGRNLTKEFERLGKVQPVFNIHIKDSIIQRSNLLSFCNLDGTCGGDVVIEDSVVQRSNIASWNEVQQGEEEEKKEREEKEEKERQRLSEEYHRRAIEEMKKREEVEERGYKQERDKKGQEEVLKRWKKEGPEKIKQTEEERLRRQREEEKRLRREEAEGSRIEEEQRREKKEKYEAYLLKQKEEAEKKEAQLKQEREHEDRDAYKSLKEEGVRQGSSHIKFFAVAIVLGLLLLGYWMLAPGLTKAPETVKSTPSPTPIITSSADQKTFTNSIGMEFVQMPAGEFDMGSPLGEKGRYENEGPVHRVKIANDFYIGKYEVTQKQWRDVMGANPSKFIGDNLPVESVSWNDVQEFIKKLNEKEGTNKYRLPSEAEWEYTVRANTNTRYFFADYTKNDYTNKFHEYAWVEGGSLKGGTKPVGQMKPNPWGLYDMYGNVWEWVQDKYHNNYTGAPTDASVWESEDTNDRVKRGCGWYDFGKSCRSAVRNSFPPVSHSNDLGFRLLMEINTDINQTQNITPTDSIHASTADQKFLTKSISMEFVQIPAGEFDMGSPSNEGGRYDDEGPVHRVKISKAFYMGKYEVTQMLWREVMGTDPSNFKGDNQPVESVSWNDVQEFIKKLNEKDGTSKYRLPSEAEWEYAARAGTTTRYSFGDDESKLGDYAWYYGNSGSKTHEVGQKKPNPWGLYDVHGNVYEWVQDSWHNNYNGAPTDGSAWDGDDSSRVGRGGSWNYFGWLCRSALRRFGDPGFRSDNLGFRLVRVS